MSEVKVIKRYISISPRKIGRLALLCVGKKIEEVKYRLSFFPQRAAREVLETVKSAENSYIIKNPKGNLDLLRVKRVIINKGPSMKRLIYRARGSADRIQKRSSHLTVIVGEGK
jgi:large subunit ribosomal protein L22